MALQKKHARQLRVYQPSESELSEYRAQLRPVEVMLVDVVDTYNVGSMFRLADAMGVRKLWLAGETEVPPNPRIHKAAVGLERWVEWEYVADVPAWLAIYHTLWPEGQVVAIEQRSNSIRFQDWRAELPLLLLAGNETTGLPEALFQQVDQVVELPMYGINRSLNVIMSLAVVLGKIV